MERKAERSVRDQVFNWSLLSNHGLVLFYIATKSGITMREMSQNLHLTERALYKIIRDLEAAEMLDVKKVGRLNSYAVNPNAGFINPLFGHLSVGDLVEALRSGRRAISA